MKCAHCGKEFRNGQVYCPHCGKMQQLVPDYNEAEEEILRDTAKHTADDPARTISDISKAGSSSETGPKAAEDGSAVKAKRKKRRLIFFVVIIILLAAVLICAAAAFRYQANHDYDLQMKKAQTAYENGAYNQALTYAQRALSLDADSTDARILLYEIYDAEGISSISLLTEVLELDPDHQTAYRYLIVYYAENDYDALLKLAQDTTEEELLALFEGYLTSAPVISPETGSFSTVTEVTILADDAVTVYYTTDGSVPTESSELYTEPFELAEGSWTITAIAFDAQGHASLTTTVTYEIVLAVPDAVAISPAGGSFTESVEITLSADDGCTIYYGWDTTDAAELTNVYSGSLWLIEGNHILSAIAVSEDGVSGEVSSRSFIYLPQEEETDSSSDTASDTSEEAAE